MIKKELFGTYNNTKIYKYTIEGEITVSVITLGARVFNIFVPDKNGNTGLAYETVCDIKRTLHVYLAAMVDRGVIKENVAAKTRVKKEKKAKREAEKARKRAKKLALFFVFLHFLNSACIS